MPTRGRSRSMSMPHVCGSLLIAVDVAIATERQRCKRKLGQGHPLLGLALRLRIDELQEVVFVLGHAVARSEVLLDDT